MKKFLLLLPGLVCAGMAVVYAKFFNEVTVANAGAIGGWVAAAFFAFFSEFYYSAYNEKEDEYKKFVQKVKKELDKQEKDVREIAEMMKLLS